MKSLKINFPPYTDKGVKASFDFTSYRDGFENTVQKAILNSVVLAGTDFVYPDRGEELQKRLAGLSISTDAELRHATNFAALSSKNFVNNYMDEDDEQIREFTFYPVPAELGSILLYANITGMNGSVSETYLEE